MDTGLRNEQSNHLQLLKFGAPGGIRTPNPQIRSLVLCPIELRARDELKFSELGIALRKSENRSANGKRQSEDLDPRYP